MPQPLAKEVEVEQFCENLQDLLELTPKKEVPFIIGDWNGKVRSQEIPVITGKFGLGVQNEAGHRLTEFCQENTVVIENTIFQWCKRQLYTWTSLHGQYSNQIDYNLGAKDEETILSAKKKKKRSGVDCGPDHQLLIAIFRLKLKKVGKTTRVFRYDLNQILYIYAGEVANRFKGLNLVCRVPKEVWMGIHTIVQ